MERRITKEWLESAKRQWGEESPVYQAQVLGEFPEQLENALINISWVERAREVGCEPDGFNMEEIEQFYSMAQSIQL